MFTQEELKNLLAIIAIAPIKGGEAMTVALLQQKISQLLTPVPVSSKTEGKPILPETPVRPARTK